MIRILLVDDFDEELVCVVERMPEVATAEGRRSIIVRFRLDEGSEWYTMQLFAISNYDDMRLNRVRPDEGGQSQNCGLTRACGRHRSASCCWRARRSSYPILACGPTPGRETRS